MRILASELFFQSFEKELILLPAVPAAIQMVLHKRKSGRSILAGQYLFSEYIQLLEAIFTANLVICSGEDAANHHPELLNFHGFEFHAIPAAFPAAE
jgi:hypothetical protein